MALAVAGKPSGGSDTLVLQGWGAQLHLHLTVYLQMFTGDRCLPLLPLGV